MYSEILPDDIDKIAVAVAEKIRETTTFAIPAKLKEAITRFAGNRFYYPIIPGPDYFIWEWLIEDDQSIHLMIVTNDRVVAWECTLS